MAGEATCSKRAGISGDNRKGRLSGWRWARFSSSQREHLEHLLLSSSPSPKGHTPCLGPRQPTQPGPGLEGCPAAGGKRQNAAQRAVPTTSSRPLPGPSSRARAGPDRPSAAHTHLPLTAVTLVTGGGESSAPRGRNRRKFDN